METFRIQYLWALWIDLAVIVSSLSTDYSNKFFSWSENTFIIDSTSLIKSSDMHQVTARSFLHCSVQCIDCSWLAYRKGECYIKYGVCPPPPSMTTEGWNPGAYKVVVREKKVSDT